jgi:hypothetical protein
MFSAEKLCPSASFTDRAANEISIMQYKSFKENFILPYHPSSSCRKTSYDGRNPSCYLGTMGKKPKNFRDLGYKIAPLSFFIARI